MLDPFESAALAVLWVLLPAYVANAIATIPKGRGPAMDFGRNWARDGRRVLGPSKTWSGFLFGGFVALPVGLLEAWLILLAPPNLQLVPRFAPTVLAAVPVVALLTFGAMTGDALGSFLKRRLGRESGARTIFLDQLPFVLVPILVGSALYPGLFLGTFASWEGVFWLLVYTLGLHAVFNWVGFQLGLKKVPW
ncbi:MAG TPA: CDP-2,3-bis-(O-geranylgeranyl)-sn-glycerol synthase [Thermoplasmata archaeon]|nr:CDP-2,3-bis-(O-geranylgeranyl)-sn-glycerol synthase [Thermoplasmata archaeon]